MKPLAQPRTRETIAGYGRLPVSANDTEQNCPVVTTQAEFLYLLLDLTIVTQAEVKTIAERRRRKRHKRD